MVDTWGGGGAHQRILKSFLVSSVGLEAGALASQSRSIPFVIHNAREVSTQNRNYSSHVSTIFYLTVSQQCIREG